MGAINFAKHDLHCRVTSTSDPFHDTWNDIQGAIEDCGEWGTVVDLGHCFNLATGPWDSWAFFRKMQQFGKDFLSTMDRRSELFTCVSSRIAADLGYTYQQNDPNFLDRLIELIPTLPLFTAKDNKVALTRWLQWFTRFKTFDEVWHTFLLALCAIGLYAGMFPTMEDLPIVAWSLPHRRANPVGFAPGAADAPDDDADGSKKSKLTSAVKMAIGILSTPGKQTSARRISTVYKPMNVAFGKMMERMRSVESTLAYAIGMSMGKYWYVLRRTWAVMEDVAALDYMGFLGVDHVNAAVPAGAMDIALDEDEPKKAQRVFNLIIRGVKHRAKHVLRFTDTCPFIFSMLLSKSLATRNIGLARARRVWTTLDAVDSRRHLSIHVRHMIAACPWTEDVYNREVLILLAHHGFTWTPPPVERMLKAHFYGWLQSAVVENGNRACRNMAREANNQGMSNLKKYVYPHLAKVIDSYERPEVQVGEEASEGPGKMPDNCFAATAVEPGIPVKTLQRVMNTRTWVSQAPEIEEQSVAAWNTLVTLAETGLWDDACNAWRAGVLPEAAICKHVPDDKYFIVVDSCMWGCLFWPIAVSTTAAGDI